MNTVRGLAAAIAPMVALFLGCGFTPPKTVPAEGKVMFHGVPVANANVQFLPEPYAPGRHIADGTTDAHGVFQLRTYFNETRSAKDGAEPGQYRVELTSYSSAASFRRSTHPQPGPRCADVPEAGTKTLNLELSANP